MVLSSLQFRAEVLGNHPVPPFFFVIPLRQSAFFPYLAYAEYSFFSLSFQLNRGGVLPKMAHISEGEASPKMGKGRISLVEVRVGKSVFRSVKRPKFAHRCILWL